MSDLYIGATCVIAATVTVYAALKALPPILLSDWAEERMRLHALHARAHLEALQAARQAYEQVIERAGREETREVEA